MARNLKFFAAALLASTAFPAMASADTARVTADLNMRAGPSGKFPVVASVDDGARVNVYGCVRGYSWCDVSWRGRRGWVAADYLTYPYQSRYVPIIEYGDDIDLPIISFSIGTYWDDYYRDRPWYGRRDHWRSVWGGNDRDRDRGRKGRDRDRDGDRAERGDRGSSGNDRADRGRGRGDNDGMKNRGERKEMRRESNAGDRKGPSSQREASGDARPDRGSDRGGNRSRDERRGG